MEIQKVFAPNTGGPSGWYRIPSMVTTKNNVVVACADARYYTGADNPNRIDKVVRRSLDSGNTWGEYIVAVQEQGTEKLHSSAAIDPVLTYVSEIGRIYMHYCHTPAGVGILNCRRCLGEDKEGNIIVRNGAKKLVLKDGALYTLDGKKTEFTVDGNGNVLSGTQNKGNIFTGRNGNFKQESTSSLMMCYSDDDGLTWSKPVSLNTQVKRSYMGFIGPGPGNGIVVQQGKYKGRIVVPIYYGTLKFPLQLSCCVIYSDDNGKSWNLGETPNNTRLIHGRKANCRTITNSQMLTESQVIEQKDGTLKYFMRNHNKNRCVATAYSKNGGESWEDFKLNENLPQPICQTSVIALPNSDMVVLLNPANKKERKCGTVRLSLDNGETFPYSRVLKEDEFVYSAMAPMPDGTIGILFEPDLKCEEIHFTKITTDWIMNKED